MTNPFKPAEETTKRLKLFIYGDTATFKTRTMLHFPDLVVIDLESGTDFYAGEFKFDRIKTNDPDEIMDAVDWLLNNQHKYKSIGIDPITLYWEALQRKWSEIFLRRRSGTKGHKIEYYDFQPKDWMTIKDEMKELLRKLMILDMNVIITAREKPLYKEGSFMQRIGTTFDGEKGLPYMFDIFIRNFKNGEKVMSEIIKDRTNKLPKLFDITQTNVFEIFNINEPRKAISKKQIKEIKEMVKTLGLTKEQIKKALENYNVEKIENLNTDTAEIIIDKLKEKIKKIEEKETITSKEITEKESLLEQTIALNQKSDTKKQKTTDTKPSKKKIEIKVTKKTMSEEEILRFHKKKRLLERLERFEKTEKLQEKKLTDKKMEEEKNKAPLDLAQQETKKYFMENTIKNLGLTDREAKLFELFLHDSLNTLSTLVEEKSIETEEMKQLYTKGIAKMIDEDLNAEQITF